MNDREAAVQEAVNEVRLVGKVSQEPLQRELPSGDVLWTFRVVVARSTSRRRGPAPRNAVDALECSVWTAGVRRRLRSVKAGDVVRVEGTLRRRFYRTPGGSASRVEIEVRELTVLRRAAT